MCFQEDSSDLYDVVNYEAKGKSGVSVQALRTLWDQRGDQQSEPMANQKIQQPSECGTVQPPALPQKTKSRRLTGTVSVDAMTLMQVKTINVNMAFYNFIYKSVAKCWCLYFAIW